MSGVFIDIFVFAWLLLILIAIFVFAWLLLILAWEED